MANIGGIPEIRVYSPSGDERKETELKQRSGNSLTNVSVSENIGFLNANAHGMYEKAVEPLSDTRISVTQPKTVFYNHTDTFVKRENVFNMRPYNLANFQANSGTTYRTSYRSQTVAINRAKLGCTFSPAKSLDLLRQNIQKSINREIDEILQKYLEKFFRPGIENIKINNGENSVSEQHVQHVCRQILEEAKKMYHWIHSRGNSPAAEFSDSENHNPRDAKMCRASQRSPFARKRKESDTDSEASLPIPKPKKKKGRPPIHFQGGQSGRSTPVKMKAGDTVKREGPKWDPIRLTPDSKFIMGAKANKALGFGATRGKLYIKHAELFKYSGDQEDKQWLHENNLMPATGGKAYMMILDDIWELAESEEYRNNPGVMVNQLVGFTVPEYIIQKMKIYMQNMRTDIQGKKRARPVALLDNSSDRSSQKSEAGTDDKTQEEGSRTVSPADELDLLGAEMPSTNPSPFSLGGGFEAISPAQEVSPSPSELSTSMEPPLTAPFDIGPSS
ncbi:deoxynucleotidyltransferase terminal-interacting protein 1 [Tachypleus tridentatus]|uniref:deoxynucleotidyltransferase terminal-interacting protein 1 n=1 Tax=Tachypleus tridentatus TaxID=6853 RepID=UPI003FD18F91